MNLEKELLESGCSAKTIRAVKQLQAQVAELSGLLKEAKKVMKADNLHRGNPDRRGLWLRVMEALKEVE